MRKVYLDHAATSRVRAEVLEAMWSAYRGAIGNASSLHTFGQEAKRALERARGMVAQALGAAPGEVYFTSGGTHSDNLAIQGAALANRERGRHLITSAIEHHAVLNTCKHLEMQGYEVTYLPVDRRGLVGTTVLRESIRDDTILISIMLANNEVGTIEPLAEITELAREKGIPVHTDAVQAVGKIPVKVDELGVDLLSLTAHKFGGPKGTGALYVRRGTRIAPLLHGGHQERMLCPGTENIPGIVGLATALRLACQEMAVESARLARLRDRLEAGIRERIAGVQLNGPAEGRLPNILNMSFVGVEGESLLLALDIQGIAVSTGSACSAGSTEPSHVLQALGVEATLAQGSLRFSLGRENNEGDSDYVLEVLPQVVSRLRELSPLHELERSQP